MLKRIKVRKKSVFCCFWIMQTPSNSSFNVFMLHLKIPFMEAGTLGVQTENGITFQLKGAYVC